MLSDKRIDQFGRLELDRVGLLKIADQPFEVYTDAEPTARSRSRPRSATCPVREVRIMSAVMVPDDDVAENVKRRIGCT